MKLIVQIAGRKVVITPEQYDRVMEITADAPLYDTKYNGKEGNVPSYYTHHIFERNDQELIGSLEALSDAQYTLAMLAGRP
tara:strand:+ start:666 stop:908 length:243 start_codon:yes stop_codon:yes gene_type:complete